MLNEITVKDKGYITILLSRPHGSMSDAPMMNSNLSNWINNFIIWGVERESCPIDF